jgi:DNA integrity scanning protein DisA with diadenylate cyclase activity
MNTTSDDLAPVNVEKLMTHFSDYTIAELVIEISELRTALEQEKKLTAAKQFKCERVEKELEELTTRINTARSHLRGDPEPAEEKE